MAAESLEIYVIHIVNTYHARYLMAVIILKRLTDIFIKESILLRLGAYLIVSQLWYKRVFGEPFHEIMTAIERKANVCNIFKARRIYFPKICEIASCENNDVNFSPIWHGDFHIYPPFVSLLRFMDNFCSIHIIHFFLSGEWL